MLALRDVGVSTIGEAVRLTLTDIGVSTIDQARRLEVGSIERLGDDLLIVATPATEGAS